MSLIIQERRIQEYPFYPTINGLRSLAFSELRGGNYKRAETIYTRALSIIKEYEKEYEHNLHKGAEYYDLGISILYQKRYKKSLEYFYLAYVEDLLNVQYNYEDEADKLPASQILYNVFNINIKYIDSIKNQIRLHKENIKRWRKRISTTGIRKIKKRLDENVTWPDIDIPIPLDSVIKGGFPPKKQCLFFGGNFKMTAYLRELRRIFISEKPHYNTFMSLDFSFKESETHDACMQILSKCGHAIFEVSVLSGQFAEMEMAKVQNIHTILIFSITEKRERKDPRLSLMAKTMGFPLEGFKFLDEVPALYHKHFP